MRSPNKFVDLYRRAKQVDFINTIKIFRKPTRIYYYKDAVQDFTEEHGDNIYYPTVIPNWDNTPRSGLNGFVLHNSTPELFKKAMINAKNLQRHMMMIIKLYL